MYLMDTNDGKTFSLPDLRREWQELRKEDPENHADTFTIEFFQILDATLRGRNDCEIEGLTGAEVFRLYTKLMKIC